MTSLHQMIKITGARHNSNDFIPTLEMCLRLWISLEMCFGVNFLFRLTVRDHAYHSLHSCNNPFAFKEAYFPFYPLHSWKKHFDYLLKQQVALSLADIVIIMYRSEWKQTFHTVKQLFWWTITPDFWLRLLVISSLTNRRGKTSASSFHNLTQSLCKRKSDVGLEISINEWTQSYQTSLVTLLNFKHYVLRHTDSQSIRFLLLSSSVSFVNFRSFCCILLLFIQTSSCLNPTES